MIVALEVPLALILQRRAVSDLKFQALTFAQTTASQAVGATGRAGDLQRIVLRQAARSRGRVIIVDRRGTLVADSSGPRFLGLPYASPGRPEIRTALARRITTTTERFSESLGQDIVAVGVPILAEGRLMGAVRVTIGLEQISGSVRSTMLGLVAIGAAGLVAGLLIALILAGSLSRPLRRLARAASRLGGGDLSARAGAVRGSREIEEVAQAFDDMASRLERTVQAQRAFAANASHQLRTPLTGMKLQLESAIAQDDPEEIRLRIEAADREVERLAAIVQRLLTLSRTIEEGGPKEADVADAAVRAVERWEEKAGRAGRVIRIDARPGAATAGRIELDQMLDNLIENAISHAGGEVTVRSGAADGAVFVAVEDQGPGIAPEEAGRVTERFYRGRGAGPGGSGLGLAIVRELAERWGGTIRIGPASGGGTRVEVRLPPASRKPQLDRRSP